MTRLFQCGFETGDSLNLFDNWSGPTVQASVVRAGGYSAQIASYAHSFTKNLGADYSELYVGFACRWTQGPVGDENQLHMLVDSAGSPQLSIQVWWGSAAIALKRGNSGGTYLAHGYGFTMDRWHYLEYYVKIANTNGRFVLKLDGTVIINYTGDTQNSATISTARSLRWGGSGSLNNYGCYSFVDDIVINSAAGSYNNTYPGRVAIYPLRPNAEGAHQDFTASAGDKDDCVDEAPQNGDTDYISDDTVGHQQTFATDSADLPSAGAVGAANISACAKIASTPGNLQIMAVEGGVDYNDSDHALTTSYARWSKTYDERPDGGGAWDLTEIAALEIGVQTS